MNVVVEVETEITKGGHVDIDVGYKVVSVQIFVTFKYCLTFCQSLRTCTCKISVARSQSGHQ